MAWLPSPSGIAVIVIVVLVVAALIYWRSKSLRRWLGRQEVHEVELGAAPVKVKFRSKKEPEESPSSAGVDFGEGGDFRGATIRGVAGRDIRRGAGAAGSPDGEAPGVKFGKEGQFRDAEIQDVAGRDIVED